MSQGYFSTRNQSSESLISASEAIHLGLAKDGGLFVPDGFPKLDGKTSLVGSLQEEAFRFLQPFFYGDPLEAELQDIVDEAFSFPCPIVEVSDSIHILELFHGPTAAFKDFGARFLAAASRRLPQEYDKRTVLVATSGDTGGAVAAAFFQEPKVDVWILYPEGRISKRQEAQLTAWGKNIRAFSVDGSFDDCQAVVKAAFRQDRLRDRFGLTSANSINLARLLPQAAYHWYAARKYWAMTGRQANLIVPTGNLGHGVASIWAKHVGAPIAQIVFALNANRAVLDAIEHGRAEPRSTIPTLANAMDVSIPSNLERLLAIYPNPSQLSEAARAYSFSDKAIEEAIVRWQQDHRYIVCPHTACGALAQEAQSQTPWLIAATAHPAKFDSIVEPLIGHKVPVPPALDALLERPQHRTHIPPTLEALLQEV